LAIGLLGEQFERQTRKVLKTLRLFDEKIV
jgi:hypothetical protein